MRVIVESPFAGGWKNILYARQCVFDSLSRGESPYASHLLYTQKGLLNDEIPEERKRGIAAADEWLDVANFVAIYADNGITEGMVKGIIKAVARHKEIRMRWLSGNRPEVVMYEGN